MNIIIENMQILLKGSGRFKRQHGQSEKKDSLIKINFKTTSFKKNI